MEEEKKREVPFKENARDGDGDGLVQDGTIHERPVQKKEEVASVVEEAPQKKPVKNVPTSIEDGRVVKMSALSLPSHAKNSASVATVQRRLLELGYMEAGGDRRGWLSVGTHAALVQFKKDAKIEAEGVTDLAVVEALFAGTKVQITA